MPVCGVARQDLTNSWVDAGRGLRVIFGVQGGVVVGMMRWGGCVVYWLVFGGELGSNLMFLVYAKMRMT